jgi:carboxyl-terminal processing protease
MMVLAPLLLPLGGCLDWPPFSWGGGHSSANTAALLAAPGVEDSLQRMKTVFEQMRPNHQEVRPDDPNVALFAEVLGRIVQDYVRVVEPAALIDGAIKGLRKGDEGANGEGKGPVTDRGLMEAAITGMMAGLDPYSSYLNPENYRNMQAQTHGEFGGLGIEVTLDAKTGFIRVVAPIDGTPAAEAGLRAGDLISDVDGVPVKGMTLIQAVFRMRGPTGTTVRLTLRHSETGPTQIVSLVRSIVKLHPVQSRVEGGTVGYVRITTFNERTAPELEDAVAKIKQTVGHRLAGLVVDLRNDPGGLLDQAVAVADDFIDSGEIVSVRGRRSAEGRSYQASGDSLIPGLPMVVLINGGSASASEIVTAALQDHKRALVVGTRSYGKGSVQTVSPLPDAGALRLTTARYYRPNGTPVDCVGVSPDLEIKTPPEPGHAEEPHQDPATCADLSVPPARPSPLHMADLCPDVAVPPAAAAPAVVDTTTPPTESQAPAAPKDSDAASPDTKSGVPETKGSVPETKGTETKGTEAKGANAKAAPDLPLRCAVSAIQSRRVVNHP